LPNELTSEIFIRYIPAYPDAPTLLGFDSPTVLTHVCCQWRDVALANPELWRAMAIDVVENATPYAHAQMRHVSNAWIERSGSCPLSIRI
ncbi:hypothetical protein C8R45DRAFT_751538, partial [Mycena sanguinolenta]